MVWMKKISKRHTVWEINYFYRSLLLITAGILMNFGLPAAPPVTADDYISIKREFYRIIL